MNWREWMRGLASVAIAGAADTFAGYAVGVPPELLLKQAAIQAISHVALYLQKSPLPSQCAKG